MMPTQPSKQLETFANPNPERDYTIEISMPEFTCLCPKTGQPDFATLYLDYIPDRKCVELKSLKLYIWASRSGGPFHEAVTNQILGDLVAATAPRYMRLRAEFYVRGGVFTTVTAEYRKPGFASPPPAPPPAGPPPPPPPAPAPAPRKPVYVGIDLGTSSCRAVAIDEKGELLAQAEAPIPLPVKSENQITQDPLLWWKAVSASLTQLIKAVGPDRIAALARGGASRTP